MFIACRKHCPSWEAYIDFGGLSSIASVSGPCSSTWKPSPKLSRQAWRNYSILAQTLYSAQTYVAAEIYATEALRLSIDELKDPAIHITQLNLALIARRTRGEAEATDLARASFNVIDGLPNDSAKGAA